MRKTIIITFLFGLISAISTYLLFDSMEGFRKEIKESKIVVKEMQQQVSSIETSYQEQIRYWVNKNMALQSRIQQTDLELERSRMKEKSIQGKILALISDSRTLTDTISIISNCDTLKEKITEFIAETNVKDSLCNAEITDLKTVILNQDSAMIVCQSSFTMLKQVTDSSLVMQSRLADELNKASKQLKKEKRRSKLLAVGAMILSGTTTFLLLQK
ncbi:MAG: hypothetical protein IT233_07680 [Bacteroidia bacterium]|nr:hypothetical protein [Bacteroidia bacterium]